MTEQLTPDDIVKEELETMPRKSHRCDECDRSFEFPQGLGRHKATAHATGVRTVKATKKRAAGTVVPATDGHSKYEEALDTFQAASANIIMILRAVATEAALYKRERDELAEFKQSIINFTGVKK
jgi:hypothetical protein